MHRTVGRALLVVFSVIAFCLPSVAQAGSGKRLLTINSVEYTNEDFLNWWNHWNDKASGVTVPASPDDFIAFQLMVQQGLEMGYDSKPSYLHKIDVFLQVRAMTALKYEEVDSKINITDSDLKRYFEDNFSDQWLLQILAFNTEDKARKAYDYLLPFQGQVAGRLVFADLHGGNAEEKADTYDEVKLNAADFLRNKKEAWLTVVRNLETNNVSQPFYSEDRNKYILLRLAAKETAGQEVFEQKKNNMTEVLYKEKRNQLSSELMEKLKKKYQVKVDVDLLREVDLTADHPREYLERNFITASDFGATVGDLIYNANKEKVLRKNVSDEVIKNIVLNSIVSQTLIKKESMARGYEKRPPLYATFEFYKQNRLRIEVESGLMGGVVVTDQEVQNYYDLNLASFSVPEKFTYFLLEANEDVLKKIWVGMIQGGDFNELAMKYSLSAQRLSAGADSLSPVLLAELKKLDKEGVNTPFRYGENFGLIKLVDRTPGQIQPLAEVKGVILDQLKKEKFEMIKAEYLAKLKSRSKIDINDRVWNRLVRELSNGKKD